jgi:oxygen-independent coproporphyrinogen-3 oxidase
MLLMGLRLAEGIDAAAFEVRTEVPLPETLDADTLEQAVEANYLAWDGTVLRATPEGRKRLDALLPRLVL